MFLHVVYFFYVLLSAASVCTRKTPDEQLTKHHALFSIFFIISFSRVVQKVRRRRIIACFGVDLGQGLLPSSTDRPAALLESSPRHLSCLFSKPPSLSSGTWWCAPVLALYQTFFALFSHHADSGAPGLVLTITPTFFALSPHRHADIGATVRG